MIKRTFAAIDDLAEYALRYFDENEGSEPVLDVEGTVQIIKNSFLEKSAVQNIGELSYKNKLRNKFAGEALQGMLAGSKGLDISAEQFAEQSYVLADAMIKAREK